MTALAIEDGKRYLLTMDDWFYSKAGGRYRAIVGECHLNEATISFGEKTVTGLTVNVVGPETGEIISVDANRVYAVEAAPGEKHASALYHKDVRVLI